VQPPCDGLNPDPDPNGGFDGLPEIEVLDLTTGDWRRLPHFEIGKVYELEDPARYVDPATGTIQIRFVNDRIDSVGLSFNIVIEGDVE
jgi:hypothetical protein